MRLFAALTLPSSIRESLQRALETFDDYTAGSRNGVRWTDPSLWHITAAFYGTVPDGAAPDLMDELRTQCRSVSPFEIHLTGAGIFADRIAWIGVGGQVEPLRTLMGVCREAGRGVGVDPDASRGLDGRHRAHVTVARFRRPADLSSVCAALSVYRSSTWVANTVSLMESTSVQGRRMYNVIDTVELS